MPLKEVWEIRENRENNISMAVREKKEQKAVRDILREYLNGITLKDVTGFVERMESDEREKFCKFCFDTFTNPYFNMVCDSMRFMQLSFIGRQAANYDEVTFGRATINGVELVGEFYEKYAGEFKEKHSKPEEHVEEHKAFKSIVTE